MTNHNSTPPLLKAAYIGTSIGALDLGLPMAGLVETQLSEQLLGTGIGELLVFGYVAAGAVSLFDDLGGEY